MEIYIDLFEFFPVIFVLMVCIYKFGCLFINLIRLSRLCLDLFVIDL